LPAHLFCSPFSSDFSVQRLLIGTHTSNDEQNYVQVLKCKVPLESSKDTREFNAGLDDQAQPYQQQGTTDEKKKERIQVEVQINHMGEVNKARQMP
jgi:histone-binding protein RBBP4